MPKKTIWYAGEELDFIEEVNRIDDAQNTLDLFRSRGCKAAATHDNNKHQIFASCRKK